MHSQAVERLEQGDIRDAAEKSWCATERATDALLLARTGEPPGPTGLIATASTTWSLQIQPLRRYRAATTAVLANCTALVSTLAHATSIPSAASGKPLIIFRCRNARRRVSVRRHSNRLVELHRDTQSSARHDTRRPTKPRPTAMQNCRPGSPSADQMPPSASP